MFMIVANRAATLINILIWTQVIIVRICVIMVAVDSMGVIVMTNICLIKLVEN